MVVRQRRSLVLFIVTAITVATPGLASAQGSPVGVVTTLDGRATLNRVALPQATSLKPRDRLYVADRVTTGDESTARILLGGKALITVRERTVLTIKEAPAVSTVDVALGRMAIAVVKERMKPGETIEIRTPNAVAAIRGTIVVTEVLPAASGTDSAQFTTSITVLRGLVEVHRLDSMTGQQVGPAVNLSALQTIRVTDSSPLGAPQSITVEAGRRMSAEMKVEIKEVPAGQATTAEAHLWQTAVATGRLVGVQPLPHAAAGSSTNPAPADAAAATTSTTSSPAPSAATVSDPASPVTAAASTTATPESLVVPSAAMTTSNSVSDTSTSSPPAQGPGSAQGKGPANGGTQAADERRAPATEHPAGGVTKAAGPPVAVNTPPGPAAAVQPSAGGGGAKSGGPVATPTAVSTSATSPAVSQPARGSAAASSSAPPAWAAAATLPSAAVPAPAVNPLPAPAASPNATTTPAASQTVAPAAPIPIAAAPAAPMSPSAVQPARKNDDANAPAIGPVPGGPESPKVAPKKR